jgi:hypothetical protein
VRKTTDNEAILRPFFFFLGKQWLPVAQVCLIVIAPRNLEVGKNKNKNKRRSEVEVEVGVKRQTTQETRQYRFHTVSRWILSDKGRRQAPTPRKSSRLYQQLPRRPAIAIRPAEVRVLPNLEPFITHQDEN